MSVNGTSIDRKTKKARSDSTSWTVKGLGSVVHLDKEGKPLTGLTAEKAFDAVRSLRRKEIFASAVRS